MESCVVYRNSTAWCDAEKFDAWYQIDHPPVVWWFLRYFFAWSHPSSSGEYLTSLKHARLCLPVYPTFTLSSVPDLFPILWISLCIFCFLEVFTMESKAKVNFFLGEPPQALWNHVVFCTVKEEELCNYTENSAIDRKPQNRRPWSSMELWSLHTSS